MIVWSCELLASQRPSGEGTTETTGLPCPAKNLVLAPVSRSQKITPVSQPTATVARGWPGPAGTMVDDHQFRSVSRLISNCHRRPSWFTASRTKV